MHHALQKIFYRIEADRARLIAPLHLLSEDVLTHTRMPGKWSILQILTHIVASEQVSINYIKKKSLGIDTLGNSGPVETMKLWLLMVSQRLPLRYKAPRVVVDNTSEAGTLSEIIARWDAVRMDMRKFMEAMDERHLRKKLYKHPIAGRLDLQQALTFMNEHVHHHWPQVKRLLKK